MRLDSFRALCNIAVLNALLLDDADAIQVKALYPTYEKLCDMQYVAKEKGYRFRYNDALYKTLQDNFTFQPQWIPGNGTSAIFAQIDETHAGTYDDPIIVPSTVPPDSFTYTIGKYYKYNEIIYKCTRSGDDEGTEYSLAYSPEQLLGQYFEVALE